MNLVGRVSELGRLRAALDRRGASLIRVGGIRGGGKTALVEWALTDYDHLVHRAPPLPDDVQRETLARLISEARTARGLAPHVEDRSPPWRELLPGILDLARADSRPFVLVLDDVHRLREARSRYLESVLLLLQAARHQGRPLHVVLVGPEHALPTEEQLPSHSSKTLRVGPLPFRAACSLLPGSRASDLLRAYGVFGGIPRVLVSLDRDVTVGTNIRRLVLAANAVLSDVGGEWIERDVQTPALYYAILSALASGEADWSAVHAGVPDLTRSGQVAPYLKRLEELGLIITRRSLDARPRARARRYAISDPFFAFWMRFVLPARSSPSRGDSTDRYSTVIRRSLDEHLTRVFPVICRQHMMRDAIETLGANAREGGSLWGAGYDLPVAGILTSGAAYYGACFWGPARRTDAPLGALDRQIRETRYGFGRERRLRLLFTGHEAPRWLQREVARRHDAELIDADALVGDRPRRPSSLRT